MPGFFTDKFWEILITQSILVAISICSLLIDLPKKADKRNRPKRKYRLGVILFTFIASYIVIGFNLKSNHKTEIIQKKSDSLQAARLKYETFKRQVDSVKLDSVLKTNIKLNDTLAVASSKLKNIESGNKNILVRQNQSFLQTAIKIQRTADTLNKYLLGNEGIIYISSTNSRVGDCFFTLNNPQKYALHPVSIHICNYSSLDNCTTWSGGRKFFSVGKFITSSFYKYENQTLPPGLQTTDTKVTISNGVKQKFLCRIQTGSHTIFEELIIFTSNGSFGYQLFIPDGKKTMISSYKSPGLYQFDWDTEFHFMFYKMLNSRD